MAKVTVNNTTFTEVLDGAGFCISEGEILYAFKATTPTNDDSFKILPNKQVNGMAGKKLWAKCLVFESAAVTAVTEA